MKPTSQELRAIIETRKRWSEWNPDRQLADAYDDLLAENARLREALKWYADGRHLDWIGTSVYYSVPSYEVPVWLPSSSIVAAERGERARTALEAHP